MTVVSESSSRLLGVSSEFRPQQGGIDYYSGIENVAIFNAVIYPGLTTGMPPPCRIGGALCSPRGCGTYVTHGPKSEPIVFKNWKSVVVTYVLGYFKYPQKLYDFHLSLVSWDLSITRTRPYVALRAAGLDWIV